MIILSIKCYCGTFGLCRDIPLMKVSVGRDSENSRKIVTVPLKSGLLATMGHTSLEEGCILIARRGSSSFGVGGHSSLEEGCVLISRRGSSSSGVGGHTSLEEGCILVSRRGSYFRWTRGTF